MNKELRQLAMDVYTGRVQKFSVAEGEEAIKEAIREACGGEFNYKNFRRNKIAVFEILEDVLTLPMGREITQLLNGCVDVEDAALGDTKIFKVPNRDRFKVAKIASGHKDLRRQHIGQDKQVPIETEWYGVKIYEEFEQLLAGRISFAELITKVREDFERHISLTVTKAVMSSYTALTSGKFYVEGALSTENLSQLVSRVEAKTNMKCAIYGTKTALSKIANKQMPNASDSMKDEYGKMGYIGNFEGTQLIELPQSLDANDDFELADDTLFVLPIGLKTIKVLFEGEANISETPEGERNDLQAEYTFMRKLGIAVCISNYHGVYKVNA